MTSEAAKPFDLATARVGDNLPTLIRGPVTRDTLRGFADASGDHVPLHTDPDFARAAGLPDVIAHGMLSMAYLAQMLTHAVPQSALRSWSIRFKAITPVDATVTCSGAVAEITEKDGERHYTLHLACHLESGVMTVAGEAVAACPLIAAAK